ncbi:hypothetical protein BA768_01320 [Chryseobacterium sp. CBo1]|uniref:DUF2199 domain-containing protein n=1 Tax=Chryseobacterium sp. CBo1 TaxID=1869230 RepID=UPI000810DB6D|nr:DUF2199 domain-containing protein [Chryseobacterium sp. CBo1]OCK53224.1 hypothetical protein BA768_01320 [Chryseobacterium sp. CBo1]
MKLFQFLNKNKETKFQCLCCGQIYDEIPLTFGSEFPSYYFTIPENEISERVEYEKSLCIIDDHFFHRVRLAIPVLDYSEDLNFDIWVTISKENFIKRNENWNDEERIHLEPYFGYLQNEIFGYQNTLNLHTVSIENKPGIIPNVQVIDDSHQLYSDQKNGISLEKAKSIVQNILKIHHN